MVKQPALSRRAATFGRAALGFLCRQVVGNLHILSFEEGGKLTFRHSDGEEELLRVL